MYNNIWYWVLLFVLILLSALFSSAEISFIGLNYTRLKNKAKKGDKAASHVLEISKDFSLLLATVIIGNNIVNLSAATLSAMLFVSLWETNGAFISTVFITGLLLIFGEVLPKNYAKINPEKTALSVTPFLQIFIIILMPISWFFTKLQKFHIGSEDAAQSKPTFTEEELKDIVNEIKDEGVLESQESELVQSALDFDETTAGDILIPRVDVTSIPIDEDIEKIKNIFLKERYTRLPVFQENKDNVVGILHQKEFFNAYFENADVQDGKSGNFSIKPLMMPPLFVPLTMKISELLKEFQCAKTHIAFVVDQHGGIDGIVTTEDILEELVGEIYDEDDEIRHDVEIIEEGVYRISGDLRLETAFQEMEYEPVHELEDQTVGAWVLDVLEKIPLEGDSFVFEKLSVTIEEIKEKRILSVVIRN